jgi:hypothetical protein
MVDTIRELSDLSRRLNSDSDAVNSTIAAINKKLHSLNLGVEAWFNTPLLDALPGDQSRESIGPFLGYCYVEDEWQLAIREKPHDWHGDLLRSPLLKASREVRVAALQYIPAVVDQLKNEAQRVLTAIRDARQFCAENLTMDKNEIRGEIILGLADRFEENKNRRATFDPTTPEEEVPLREVLAELNAEGSLTVLANTYQFTLAGYNKYREQIAALRALGRQSPVDHTPDSDLGAGSDSKEVRAAQLVENVKDPTMRQVMLANFYEKESKKNQPVRLRSRHAHPRKTWL